MKNFIVFDLCISAPVNLRWGNNEQELTTGPWYDHMEIEIHQCEEKNTFWIHNHDSSSYEIRDITMYGFGQGKIKHWGRFLSFDGGSQYSSNVIAAKGSWTIDWQYPTFTWLHKNLDRGWLVKPSHINGKS